MQIWWDWESLVRKYGWQKQRVGDAGFILCLLCTTLSAVEGKCEPYLVSCSCFQYWRAGSERMNMLLFLAEGPHLCSFVLFSTMF